MQNSPITYSSSAAGTRSRYRCSPIRGWLYQNIFGCVAGGKSQESFLAETAWYDQLIDDSDRLRKRLSGAEAAKFDTYIDGLRQIKRQRLALMALKDSLAQIQAGVHGSLRQPSAQRRLVGG